MIFMQIGGAVLIWSKIVFFLDICMSSVLLA